MRRFPGWFALLAAAAVFACAVSVSFAENQPRVLSLIEELSEGAVPEGAEQWVQYNLHQETVGNVEIRILEAAYDGRSLFLSYSFRMADVDTPLGITAAEMYGGDLPDGVDPDSYADGLTDDSEGLLYDHGAGWWIDEIWIDGRPLGDMPEDSGQYFTGTGEPGEIIETDVWRLDSLDVSLDGKVTVSLPIGERQDIADYISDDHPEKYGEDGGLLLPGKGIVSFELDTKNVLSAVTVSRPVEPTALPEVTVSVKEAAFTPLMTYVKLNLAVNPDAMNAFIAENGEAELDDSGEVIWKYDGMDVFSPVVDNMRLVDGDGNLLSPNSTGPSVCSADSAEFIFPAMGELPDTVYLAAVSEDGVPDMARAVLLLPADE